MLWPQLSKSVLFPYDTILFYTSVNKGSLQRRQPDWDQATAPYSRKVLYPYKDDKGYTVNFSLLSEGVP